MAVTVVTDDSEKLLAKIRKGIKDSSIVMWIYTPRGSLTHTAPKWKYKAWFKPSLPNARELKFNIIRPKGQKISKEVYAFYHGRFAQMLLIHFDSLIDSIQISALAESEDLV